MSGIRLGRRLVLEEAQAVGDGAGGLAESWVSLGTLWAEVSPGAGREAAGEEVWGAQVPLRITVRAALPGDVRRPKPGQRFREGVRLFRILAVSERDAGGRYLACVAREEVPA